MLARYWWRAGAEVPPLTSFCRTSFAMWRSFLLFSRSKRRRTFAFLPLAISLGSLNHSLECERAWKLAKRESLIKLFRVETVHYSRYHL